ncbi:MAG: beta-propeller fold lactonase family protein [Planctomycetia bacterium]|jgi:DNA-binding beta-propeller fold protein YncE|nr:beta-propeller fold lactonase family protein [Planctomycetia bacterium]
MTLFIRTLAVISILLIHGGLFSIELSAQPAEDWVNWESPPVHPLEKVPGSSLMLAVNTADDQLEVHDVANGVPEHLYSIPVGIDPVSVRAFSSEKAWVVNRISDSISVVDLVRGTIDWTIQTSDEPADVIFAGDPIRAYVSCSGTDEILMFDPSQARPVLLQTLNIVGEEPRALSTSPDGSLVYCAIFESGNGTTLLGGGGDFGTSTLAFPPNVVNEPSGPYGGLNPPPNSGSGFNPPFNGATGTPPEVGLIVRKQGADLWLDDNGSDWSDFVSGPQASLSGRPVGWDLADHDVAVIDTSDQSISYISSLMNICMSISVRPTDGAISVIGTDAHNEIRYEPNLNGNFIDVLHVMLPEISIANSHDLNPHLPTTGSNVAEDLREISIGDPRALVWNSAGTTAYVAGKGSNNVIRLNEDGSRDLSVPPIEVGAGAAGLVIEGDWLYVLEHFDGSLAAVDLTTGQVVGRVQHHDPTPTPVKEGRKFLYDTHLTSGMGQVSCASCHVDARTDRLSWDLGDPSGDVELFTDICNMGLPLAAPGDCDDFHPMKGPMLTQSMQDIIGKEPHHWRGDRFGIEAFGGAFLHINGDDLPLVGADMQLFEDFLASIHYPPNPFRNLDNSLPTAIELEGHFTTGRFAPEGQPLGTGNAEIGLDLYRNAGLDGGLQCVTCHTLPVGIGPNAVLSGFQMQTIPDGASGEKHHGVVSVDGSTQRNIKIPQLRNIYKRSGFNTTQQVNTAGFGFLHDGSVDSVERFLAEPAFDVQSDQELAHLVAFMLAFSGSDLPEGSNSNPFEPAGSPAHDTHAGVGKQITFDGSNNTNPQSLALLELLRQEAALGRVGLIAHAFQAGVVRGYFLFGNGAVMQSDSIAESSIVSALVASASAENEVTFMAVDEGSTIRMSVDRDLDGFFNYDEVLACSDPADPQSTPVGCGGFSFIRGDANKDLSLDISDVVSTLDLLFGGAGDSDCDDAHDSNDDGNLDIADPVALLGYLFSGAGDLPMPSGSCGVDPTTDQLECTLYSCP